MELAIDGDLDLGLAVVGELDLVDGADRLAADQDLVALDELAAGLEQEPVLVAAVAAAEEDEGDRDDDEHQRAERGDSAYPAAAPDGWRRPLRFRAHSDASTSTLFSRRFSLRTSPLKQQFEPLL